MLGAARIPLHLVLPQCWSQSCLLLLSLARISFLAHGAFKTHPLQPFLSFCTDEWTLRDGRGTQICFSMAHDRVHSMTLWPARNGNISGLLNAPKGTFDEHQRFQSFQELLTSYYPHIPQVWVPQIAAQLQAWPLPVHSQISLFATMVIHPVMLRVPCLTVLARHQHLGKEAFKEPHSSESTC